MRPRPRRLQLRREAEERGLVTEPADKVDADGNANSRRCQWLKGLREYARLVVHFRSPQRNGSDSKRQWL